MVHVPDSPVTFGGGFARGIRRNRELGQGDRALDISEDRNRILREQAEQAAAEAREQQRRTLITDALAPLDRISEMVQDPKDGNDFAISLNSPGGEELLEEAIRTAQAGVQAAGGDPASINSRVRLLREMVRFKSNQPTGLSATFDEFVKTVQKINPEFEPDDVPVTTLEQMAGLEPGALAKTIATLEKAAVDAGLDPKEAVPFEFKKQLAVAGSKGMTVNVGTFRTLDKDGNLEFSPLGEGGPESGTPLVKEPSPPTANLLAEDRNTVSQLDIGLQTAQILLEEFQKDPSRFAAAGSLTSKVAGGLDVLKSLADLTLKVLPERLEEASREFAKDIGITEPSEASKDIGSFEVMENRLAFGIARARNPEAERITDTQIKLAREDLDLRNLFIGGGKVEGKLGEIIQELTQAKSEAQRIGEQNVGGVAKTPKFQRQGSDLPTFSSPSDEGWDELPPGSKFIDGNTGIERTKN